MRRNYGRDNNQFGLSIGPFSKEILRSASTTRGRYIIYIIALCSLIGLVLEYLIKVPYELTIGIIIVVLVALILNMERIINKINERQRKFLNQRLEEREKDLSS